jgi:hypothetical protein
MCKPLPIIHEDTDSLKQRVQHEHNGRRQPRLQMLYWLACGQAQTRLGVAQLRGVHRVARVFAGILDRLIQEYRQAPVKHADDRGVPAENNLAERDLRPTDIARKVSFGCQSDAGAHTRGVLMSVLHTLKERQVDMVAGLKAVLDLLAVDIQQDPFPFLFPEAPT